MKRLAWGDQRGSIRPEDEIAEREFEKESYNDKSLAYAMDIQKSLRRAVTALDNRQMRQNSDNEEKVSPEAALAYLKGCQKAFNEGEKKTKRDSLPDNGDDSCSSTESEAPPKKRSPSPEKKKSRKEKKKEKREQEKVDIVGTTNDVGSDVPDLS